MRQREKSSSIAGLKLSATKEKEKPKKRRSRPYQSPSVTKLLEAETRRTGKGVPFAGMKERHKKDWYDDCIEFHSDEYRKRGKGYLTKEVSLQTFGFIKLSNLVNRLSSHDALSCYTTLVSIRSAGNNLYAERNDERNKSEKVSCK